MILVNRDEKSGGRQIYAAGGFSVDEKTQKALVVNDVQRFDEIEQTWREITKIEGLSILNILSFEKNELLVNEISNPNDLISENKILRTFDLENLRWKQNET